MPRLHGVGYSPVPLQLRRCIVVEGNGMEEVVGSIQFAVIWCHKKRAVHGVAKVV